MNYAYAQKPSRPAINCFEVVGLDTTAIGKESDIIREEARSSIDHYIKPITLGNSIPLIKFLLLTDIWKAETAFLSSITAVM